MNFNKLQFSPLFEKTLIRFISEFDSEMNPSSIQKDLSKELKSKVSTQPVSSHNINITRRNDGTFVLETGFLLYRDARLAMISLFKWLERNAKTKRTHNFFIDIKFLDAEKGPFKGTLFNKGITIEKIDKLKMILDFNESKIYDIFPSRRYGFISKTISRFEPIQKFIPKTEAVVDPKFYSIPDTTDCGINFETLNKGFLRFQYIGGENYESKSLEILDILNEFIVSAWNCTVNPGFTKENISSFEKLILKQNKIRESYLDYQLFKKNFPGVVLTVDLMDDPKSIDVFYQRMRESLYELLSNIEFKGEMLLNYDTTFALFQIKEANLKINSIKNVEFVNCKIEYGKFDTCDFYKCDLNDGVLYRCNLFLDSTATRCRLIDSVCNRTTEIYECEFEGFNGALNGKMEGGIFKSGGIGVHAEISEKTVVIEYRELKPGYIVAGDRIIIPTKKFRPI